MSISLTGQRRKPLDFSDFCADGGLGINGSLDHVGRIIALNNYHPKHGYVTFTSALPFTEADRYDSASVRRYRADLASLDGIGYTFNLPTRETELELLEGVVPRHRLIFADNSDASCTTFALAGGVIQIWETQHIMPRWTGRVSIQRCAYTQITEGGPLTPVSAKTSIMFQDGILIVHNADLPHAVAIAAFPPQKLLIQEQDGDPINLSISGQVGRSVLIYGLGETPDEAIAQVQRLSQLDAYAVLEHQLRQWRQRWHDIPDSLILRRGLSYSLALGIPVGAGVCLFTDHMLLPLSWNRDAYYMALALLHGHQNTHTVVRRHLIWMFEQADRLDGAWGRCYLANGRIKDAAFQLDQQLFPLLELADYVLETDDQSTLERLRPHIRPLIESLLARRYPTSSGLLLPTDETPADDPIHFPYHLSSHLLLWRVFNRLHQLDGDPQWESLAKETQHSIQRYFVAEHEGVLMFAYATDGQGQYHFYHDANDLPLVLAPLWGLIDSADPVWRETLKFAFSERNMGGYYAGHLGSVHTRAPWALGDLQALIAADLMNDEVSVARAWNNLKRAAQWDGALPEGYEADSGTVLSRHWFAWPGAAVAWYLLERHRRQLQPSLY
ncbi:MAG: glycoside hydrolase family 125 protein [Anaerolineae bacterium]|nr:glycoside hydrolase family 125 protein [Anaerolineae bacterium]